MIRSQTPAASIPAQAPVRNIMLSTPRTAAAPISLVGAQQNELLRALDRVDLERLFPHLELVQLKRDEYLYDFGSKFEYAYFPTNAIVSLHYVMEDGATTEIGVVGREGVLGVAMYDNERATCAAVVQAAGYGYRLKTEALRDLFNEGGAFAQLLMRHTMAMFGQLAQNVVGTRHCTLEQKLSRWLLERLDRSLTCELKVTQETMATMLGVRRESITLAAGKLQAEGLIQYRRGTVAVLDRDGLETCAGACYKAGRIGFDQMRSPS
jgi:CRP-like cAMP-binding protein